jgi:hypothetical protein
MRPEGSTEQYLTNGVVVVSGYSAQARADGDRFMSWQSKYPSCVITAPDGDHQSETCAYKRHSLGAT